MPIGSSTVAITPSLLLNHKCFVVPAKKFTGKLRKYLRFKMGKYRRKTNKASWTSSQLTEAMQAIENKEMTMRGAAKKYGIPVMTLSDRFKTKNVKAPRLGRKTILSEKCEVELESFLMEMQNIFCGVTQLKLRRLAFEIAEKNNIKHSFNREKKLAGKAWLYGFLQRKPWIRLRTAEATSLARALGFNKEAVKRFFDNLKEVQKKYNFPPSRIYNQDETGLSTVHVPPKILARKGVKQIGKITTAERGVNITVSCCFNATGTYIPPFFIFPRKNMSSHLLHGAPPESVGHASTSGWMNAELFLKWLQHFAKYAKPTLEDPVLLILDNHCSHISIPAWDFCREKNIIMLSIPPHTSHKLQPLDRTFYKSLKNNYYIECDKWIINNLRRRITEYDVAKIFQVAYEKSATMEKATRGFQCTGIYPFNPEIFSDEDFVVAKAMEVPQPGQSGEASHSAQPSEEAAHSAQTSGESVTVSSHPENDQS